MENDVRGRRSVFMRLGQRLGDHDVPEDVSNVFILNFPSHFTLRELQNTCAKFGKVYEVFIAKKRSKSGVPFGFVKFDNSVDVDMAIAKLCDTWIGKLKLRANLARFDKQRNPIPGMVRVQLLKQSVLQPPSRSSGSVHGMSYADVLQGKPKEVINLDDLECIEFPLAVMGCTRDFDLLPNLHDMCLAEGFTDVDIKYIGGLWVLFNFDSAAARDNFYSHVGICSWFVELKYWSKGFFPEERLAWLEIEDIPLDVWGEQTFQKIVQKWGSIHFMGDTEQNNLYSRQVCIKTKEHGNIIDSVVVSLHGKERIIRIREVIDWIPEFLRESVINSEEARMGSPVDVDVSQSGQVEEAQSFYGGDMPVCDDENLVASEAPLSATLGSDPFNLMPLIEDLRDSRQSCSDSLQYPPGYHPNEVHVVEELGSRQNGCAIGCASGGQSVSVQRDQVLPAVLGSGVVSKGVASAPLSVSVVNELEQCIEMGKTIGIDVALCEHALEKIIRNCGDLDGVK